MLPLQASCFGIVSTTYKNTCWLSLWAQILNICDKVRQRKNTDGFLKFFVCFMVLLCFLIDMRNIIQWATVQ